MAGGKPIRISILANAQKAISETNKMKKALGDLGDATGASKLKNGLKNVAKGVAVGAGAAIVAVGALAVQTAKDLMRVERLGAQTTAVIKATGGAAGRSKTEVDAMAGQLERLTGAEAESITEGQNMLLTFKNIKGDQFDAATKAALDMGVAMNNGSLEGLDLQKTSIQLGKALNDPIKGISALSKVGVSFNEQQKEQIKNMVEAGDVAGAQGVILKELQGEFGGAAEAAGKTTEGMMAKVQNAFGDVAEEVFAFILPMLQKVLGYIQSNVLPAMEKFGAWLKTDGAEQAKAFGESFKTNVLPTLKVFGAFLMDVVVPAVVAFGKFLVQNGKAVLITVGVIATLVTAYQGYMAVMRIIVALETLSTALKLKKIKAWIAEKAAIIATTIASRAQSAALAAMYASQFLAAQARMIAGWVAQKVAIVASAIATKSAAAAQWIYNTAIAAGGGAKAAAIWVAQKVAIVAMSAATKTAAAVQWLFNAAMTANPIGLIIAAVAALVAGLIWFFTQTKVGQAIIKVAWAGIQTAIKAVTDWWQNTAWPTIKTVWASIVGAFKTGKAKVAEFMNAALAVIKKVWQYTPLGFIITNWDAIVAWIAKIPGRVKAVFDKAIGFIKTIWKYTPIGLITNNWDAIISWLKGIPGKVKAVFDGAVAWLKTAGKNVLTGLKNGLTAGWAIAGDWLGGIAGKITSAVGGLGSTLYAHGQAILTGFLNGLKSTWKGVTDFVGGIADWIAANKGPLSYDKRLLRPAGKAIMEGLRVSMERQRKRLKKTLQAVTRDILAVQDDIVQKPIAVRAASSVSAALATRPTMPSSSDERSAASVSVTFEPTGDRLLDAFLESLRKTVRVNGGNVQAVIGTGR